MNAAIRAKNNYMNDPSGSDSGNADLLLLTVAGEAMGSSDSDKPMTAVVAYLENLCPGNRALEQFKARWAGTLTAEAQR